MRNFSFIFILICSFSAAVQAQCIGGNRYRLPVFSYDSVMNVKYGANVTASSSTPQDLLLDVYLPANDTFSKRPVIFFTHGGSFLFGTKADGDVVYLCREFARRGYVCISQDYRLGFESFDQSGAIRGVWRAMQDSRAAVRYMKANADSFKIDTNMIIYGGSSAGAFCALNVAFLDEPQEIPAGIDTSAYAGSGSLGLGNFRGTTNNLPNSDNVHAVVNLCGAMGDTSWIQPKDSNIAVISLHGTADATVPYGSAVIKLLGSIPLLEVDGSASIRERMNNIEHPNYFFTYCGQDHVPYAGLAGWQRAWMDTTVRFVAKHLYENVLKCGFSGYYTPQIDSADCPKGLGIAGSALQAIEIFPNPVAEELQIKGISEKTTCTLYGINGMLIWKAELFEDSTLDLGKWDAGVYFLRLQTNEEERILRVLKQ
jgi:hypothetical protein